MGLLEGNDGLPPVPVVGGDAAVLAGSCLEATLAQVAEAARRWPAFFVDPLALGEGKDDAAAALSWASTRLHEGPVLIYSSAALERSHESSTRWAGSVRA